jgi:hypothetical protein
MRIILSALTGLLLSLALASCDVFVHDDTPDTTIVQPDSPDTTIVTPPANSPDVVINEATPPPPAPDVDIHVDK